jgi:hypothetical protein
MPAAVSFQLMATTFATLIPLFLLVAVQHTLPVIPVILIACRLPAWLSVLPAICCCRHWLQVPVSIAVTAS